MVPGSNPGKPTRSSKKISKKITYVMTRMREYERIQELMSKKGLVEEEVFEELVRRLRPFKAIYNATKEYQLRGIPFEKQYWNAVNKTLDAYNDMMETRYLTGNELVDQRLGLRKPSYDFELVKRSIDETVRNLEDQKLREIHTSRSVTPR